MDRYRNTWVEVDLEAIQYNITQLRNLLPEGHKAMAVVKADGYGHGSVQVARAALNVGIDFLMVALLEEAIHLRNNGIDVPIFVIGRVRPEDVHVAIEHNITLAAFQLDWIKRVNELTLDKKLHIHLEFETGMNRTGITSVEELEKIVAEVKHGENVKITGAFTHFATADEIESELFHSQYARYQKMLMRLTELYPEDLITHVGNSAAGIQYSDIMLHYTRFGVSIYGLYPSDDIRKLETVDLRQAFSLYSELVQVKKIKSGEAVSYGATFRAEEDTWIGTLPIGYADGWSRALQGFHVLVDGKKMPIVGRICMDSLMIQLDKEYPVGQKVTLIGKDGDQVNEVDDVARYLDTINYEVPCMLTSRIPREYV
ncbi:MAG TPA: alanine racemase [Pseudogracilibacillus sp.]|nr:alanine racemase [Pseudogracilibacillus sp.]